MSRRASVVAAVAVAAMLPILLPSPASAQCDAADQCSPQECRQRQSRVHPTCDQPRSCAAVDAGNKNELRRRLTINEQCLTARLNVAQCFSNSDPGHDQAIIMVQSAIAVCTTKINQ